MLVKLMEILIVILATAGFLSIGLVGKMLLKWGIKEKDFSGEAFIGIFFIIEAIVGILCMVMLLFSQR